MLTWIDEWCNGMRLRRERELRRNGSIPDRFCKSDGLAAREATLDALSARSRYDQLGIECPLVIAFMSQLAWFLASPQLGLSVRALQLTNALIAELEECELTEASVKFTRAAVDTEIVTYIDIPPGTFRISQKAELRALFLQPVTMAEQPGTDDDDGRHDVLSYCAVVTPASEYGFRYAMWTDDRSQFVSDNYNHAEAGNDNFPTFDELLVGAGWSQERFQDEIERLVYLALQYAKDEQRVERQALPHMAADNERRRPGRGRDIAQRFSLFKVERLTLRQRMEGTEAAPRAPWRLEKRIFVNPHWRRITNCDTGDIQKIAVRGYYKGPDDGLPVHSLRIIKTEV